MKKRGQATLWFFIELVAAILVVYLAIDVARALSEGTIFEKRNIARDLAMQINTLSDLPGDGYIVNNDLHGYSVHIINNRVEVYQDASETLKGIHSFVPITNSNLDVVFDVENTERIVIAKIGNDIRISKNIPNLG